MSEKGYWSSDWMAVQQKYWEEWLELSRRATGAEAVFKNPWEQAQDHWWQAVSPAAPAETRAFVEKMMQQGKQLFRLAALFSPTDASTDWREILERVSGELRRGSGVFDDEGAQATRRLMGFWEMPMDSWQHMVSSLSLLPQNLLGGLSGGGGVPADLNQLLSTPGLGYTREQQEQQQKLVRLLMEYRAAQERYAGFFSDTGVRAVERMRRAVEQRAETGEVIDSARAFYDLWVTTCEEVYTEQVMTPEYAQINGQLVNALMAVRHQQGVMVDENLSALHVPTRRELRTLQTRMQENRRENKRLMAQIQSLREQLERLGGTSGSAPAVRRKTTRRKVDAGKN